MTLVSPTQSNPGDTIEASDINDPVNQIAAVVNGNIDSTNISSVSGAKLQAGTVAASALDTNANVETRMSESAGNFVASGCVWSTVVALDGTMSSGVLYIAGRRVVVNAVTSRTFTASKDTYVSIDSNGTPSYSEVANAAAPPSLPASSIFVARVITNASAITSVVIANGKDAAQVNKTATQSVPNASSTVVTWSTVPVFDRNLLFDPSTGRFYVRTPGVYAIYAQIRLTAAGGTTTTLNVYVNGSQRNDRNNPSVAAFAAFSTDTALYLEAGSYIDVRLFQDSGASRTIDSNSFANYFYCAKIG